MDSYAHTFNCYPSSPATMPCMYTNFNTPPSTSYCPCCYPSTSYYYSHPISPPTTPYMHTVTQISTPPKSTKVTRLQYSNKDRYILNELFKRTPYPNAIQRDVIARQLGISQEQIRIWFQNRRRLQTQRDTGERLATANELAALQMGKSHVNSSELKQLLNEVTKYKNAPPRLRLDESA
ncbi:unnamed protein product [Adineta ricciae]|uniref:Homeobox domain-containing protein n=1 Tax=Adineta ricciae TaxID=249248 RepID=A0A813R808_ADIRI|nr:unnamed protein product [Adineta ricciae]CAF0805073.1 unnamed protein product [Adineta ricciae]